MKKLLRYHLIFCFFLSCVGQQKEPLVDIPTALDLKEQETSFALEQSSEFADINFAYKDAPLLDIINALAFVKGINVIFQSPTVLQYLTTTKLTYTIPGRVTPTRAWNELRKILDMAGYSIMTHNKNLLEVKSIGTADSAKLYLKDPIPIYISPALSVLPDTEQIIRVVFYPTNLKVDAAAPIRTLLTEQAGLLSGQGTALYDTKSNAIIITDKANYVHTALQVVMDFDAGGVREALEVYELYYTKASEVELLFQNILSDKGQGPAAMHTYFPKNTKIVPIKRTNALMIMGTPKAIATVRNFIIKYIDHPQESGKSILHVYELQYLRAIDVEPLLSKLFGSGTSSGQGTTADAGGSRQGFQGVIIKAEAKNTGEKTTVTPIQGVAGGPTPPTTQTEGVQQNGNRLIIAARKQDWVRIKKYIKDLDKPQLQVALEVLIVDLTLQDQKALGSQLRNKEGASSSLDRNINFQTGHLASPILRSSQSINDNIGPSFDVSTGPIAANALMANLLELFTADPGNSTNLATALSNPNSGFGSLILSINDSNGGGIWNVWQVLKRYSNSTILSQPFIVTLNNKQAEVKVSQQRFLDGDVSGSNGGLTIKKVFVPATLQVAITPRISLSNNINLDIVVVVQDFIGTSEARTNRAIVTNTNVGNGEILALGGLTTENVTINMSETPLLSKVPLVGWFFKKEAKVITKNNLLVFICPTIIEPFRQGGMDHFTERKSMLAKEQLDESVNLENLRDPITRWFFQPEVGFSQAVVDSYTAQEMFDDKDGVITLIAEDETVRKRKSLLPESKAITLANQAAQELKELAKDEKNPLLRLQQERDQLVLNT